MKIKSLVTLILLFTSSLLSAQIFDNEQSHSRIKWKQIDTQSFRVIFPEQFSSTAQQLANTIEQQLLQASHKMPRKPQKTTIIIQENTVLQNGFVQLAPRKSEIYSTPSGIADNQSWLNNLTLHEVRHIAQIDNLTGKIKKPFGEQLAIGLFGLNFPSWYYEGDAVVHETLFSKGGRGRLSSWNMPLRAHIQSKKEYSFNKYVHGSFKDLVPSYYTIGYFLNSELYKKDPEITSKIYTKMNKNLLRPFNFQRTLKEYYGQTASNLFVETINNLSDIWGTSSNNPYPNRMVFQDKYPTNYMLPQIQNESLYALQQSHQRTDRIVKSNKRKINEIVKIGPQLMPYYEIKKHLIVWDEIRRNARFSKETYNVISIYDTSTKKKKTLTHETRYYTPTLSPDLKSIACVEVDNANNSFLTLLETSTGKKVKSIKIPTDTHIQQPKYHLKGEKIIAIGVSDEGTNLIEIDLQKEKLTSLLPWSNTQIESPIYYQDMIVFSTNINGKDDIFALKNGITYRITDTQFGAFNPSLSGSKLYFNDYMLNGYQINSINLDSIHYQEAKITPSTTLYYSQNKFNTKKIDSSNKTYPIENFNSFKNLINFHSISLSGSDFENFNNLKPGIFFLSNDILNNMQSKIGFEYDTNIKKTSYSAQVTYQKYYPKISFTYKNKGLIGLASSGLPTDSIRRFSFRENQWLAEVQLPMIKYRGNNIYSFGANFGTSYQLRHDPSIPNLKNFHKEIAFPLNYQLYFNRNSRKSKMDLYPKWGQNFSFIYRHLPFESKLSGSTWSLRTNFYLPGFMINHSLRLRYSMQENSGTFSNTFDIPLINGINYIPFKRIKNTLLIDYTLPLAYPDWSLINITYLKRIYGAISANYMNIDQSSSIAPQSWSTSLYFDFNMFKYNLPNFLLETKVNFITAKGASKRVFPELSLTYTF